MATRELPFTMEDVRHLWDELVALRHEVQILRQEKKQKNDVYNYLVLNDATSPSPLSTGRTFQLGDLDGGGSRACSRGPLHQGPR
jgi:hypothetical protein